MKFDFVVFDLDGTLINTLEGITVSVNHALKALNVPYQYEENEVKTFIGRGARRLFRLAMKRDFSEEEYKLYLKYYKEDQIVSSVYEGVEETLKTLEENGIKLLIYSNKPNEVSQPLIKAKLGNINFLHIQGQDPRYPPKPDVTLLLKLLKKYNLIDKKGLYVGDSIVDIETAKNANLENCILTYGYGDKKEIEEGSPTYKINKFEDLIKIVL
ncbi:MAG: HAD-IA family hydrolase [Bacilli bacterium]|nr:HAD-IA family hydrolase [Bacilli bacterium]